MSEQGDPLARLSKSQKKKKAAQKKKLAKKIDKANEEQKAAERAERRHDELDARMVEQFHDKAMQARDFQMFNIRGKLLAHPSQSFLEALTSLRQAMGRESYPNRICHAQRLYHLGMNNVPLPSLSVAMGTASYVPVNRFLLEAKEESPEEGNQIDGDGESKVTMFRFAQPVPHGRTGAFTDDSWGALGLMVWYPIFTLCMASGDKLSCIALRDTCVFLRTCYGIFRNDITRVEQFVFDSNNPGNVKQLEWVARRIEVPPSPPQTPPRGFDREEPPSDVAASGSLLTKDPFRSPIVLTKRWSDYDDDDESLGSPMALPITPESSSDVPAMDLGGSSDGSDEVNGRKEVVRRAPTTVVAVPMLTDSAHWFSTVKTVLPTPRISLFTPETYPRSSHTVSLNPMKLQSSSFKIIPGATGKRVRGRLEQWVREDAEKKLKAKLLLSSIARKKADVEAENIIYNRMVAVAGLNTGETTYIGEPDILGSGRGLCLDDVRDIVTGRFREKKAQASEGDAGGVLSSSEIRSKVMLVPSTEGWVCKHLGESQP